MLPCRRHGKKRNGKDVAEDEPGTPTEDIAPLTPAPTPAPSTPTKKEGNNKKGSKNQNKQQSTTPLSRAETPNATLSNTSNPNNTSSNNSTTNGSPTNTSAFSAPVNQNAMMNSNSNLINMASMIENFTDAQLQSNQISSTVLDSPYSYDYATGSYIDKRNYYNQQWIPPHAMEYGYPPPDRNEQVKSRGSEENPDSTTLINANNSGSAFSPSVLHAVDPTKRFPLSDDPTKRYQPQAQPQQHTDHGFVKPKPPEYPTAYGYHSTQPTYPVYPYANAYNQPHHYNNIDYYNNDKLRYNFYSSHHHHPPHHHSYNPYDIYHQAPDPTQLDATKRMPTDANAQMDTSRWMPTPNWNLFPTDTTKLSSPSLANQTEASKLTAASQPAWPTPNWNLFSPAAPAAVRQDTTKWQLSPEDPVKNWQSSPEDTAKRYQLLTSATPPLSQPNLAVDPPSTLTAPSLPTLSPSVSEDPKRYQQTHAFTKTTPASEKNSPVSEKIEETSPVKIEPIGEITEINDNVECFQDSQMGGIGIALEHGSVLIECAKHEMHATSSVKKPNRKNPTRITLIFYQHRNLNRHRHGIEEWEEKMRLKRLGITLPPVEEPKIEAPPAKSKNSGTKSKAKSKKSKSKNDAKEKKQEKSNSTSEVQTMIKEETDKFDIEKSLDENDDAIGQQQRSMNTGAW